MRQKKLGFGGSDKEHEKWAKADLEWANYKLGVVEMLVSSGSNYCDSAYDQLVGAREAIGSYLSHRGHAAENPARQSMGPKARARSRATETEEIAAKGEVAISTSSNAMSDPGYREFFERYRPLADTFKKICATPAWKGPEESAPPPSPKTPKSKRVDVEVQRASPEPVEPPIPKVKREPRPPPDRVIRTVTSADGSKCRIRLVADPGCNLSK